MARIEARSDSKDAAYFVKQLKEMVGLGEIDESAEWINIMYHDRRRSRVLPRGSLALSVGTFDVIEATPKYHYLILRLKYCLRRRLN